MKRIKVSELEGAALDWAVAKCEGFQMMYFDEFWRMRGELKGYDPFQVEQHLEWQPYRHQHVIIETYTFVGQDGDVRTEQRAIPISRYSTDWAQGGPIIEREGSSLIRADDDRTVNGEVLWDAIHKHRIMETDTAPLIAAMRCYVASKLGDEIEVPEELLK